MSHIFMNASRYNASVCYEIGEFVKNVANYVLIIRVYSHRQTRSNKTINNQCQGISRRLFTCTALSLIDTEPLGSKHENGQRSGRHSETHPISSRSHRYYCGEQRRWELFFDFHVKSQCLVTRRILLVVPFVRLITWLYFFTANDNCYRYSY